MGVIVTGHNSPTGFTNSEAVTVANLNSHVNSSTFDTTAVDDSSIELTNTNTKLQLKDATSTTTGTTLGKLQYIGNNKVLGRVASGDGVVEQLTLDTDLSTVSASHNELASSKAIKDYIDTQVSNATKQYFHLQERTTSGSASACTLVAGQYTKRFVTSVGNFITGASTANNVITLPAGRYTVSAFANAGQDNAGITPHRIRLRNTTDNTTTILGSSVYTIGQGSFDYECTPSSCMNGAFTITDTKNFELQHWKLGTGNVNGGVNVNSGEDEVHADILFHKIN